MKKWLAKGHETCYFVRQRMASWLKICKFLVENVMFDFDTQSLKCFQFFYTHTNTKICLKEKQWWPTDQTFAF